VREQHASRQHRGIRSGARARYADEHCASSPCGELGCLAGCRRDTPSSGAFCGWGDLTECLSPAEKLKFTPPPQPLQCMEFDKEVTVSCSATGREKPTIQWTKTGKGDLDAVCLFLTWGPREVTLAHLRHGRSSGAAAAWEAAVWHSASCVTTASLFLRPADGSSLPSHVSHNAGILSFHKVSRSDSGNYTCIASNSPQGEIRATVQLVVAGEGSRAGRWVSCCAGLAVGLPGWHPTGVLLQREKSLA